MASLSRTLRVAAICSQGRSAWNLRLQPLAREARLTTEKNVPYQRTLKEEESQGASVVPQGPSQPLPSTADVVVIGGGSLGCQTLYHLAKLGVGQVVLLERERLTSGTTWHTAGERTSRWDTAGVRLGDGAKLERKDVCLGWRAGQTFCGGSGHCLWLSR